MYLLKLFSIVFMVLRIQSKDKLSVNECKNNWFNYKNEKCIKLLNETKFNYTDAKQECTRLDSKLLTIQSREENLFITSLLYQIKSEVKGLFIGLKRKTLNNTFLNEFEWEDKSELSFENWSPGEPSPWDEECVEIYSIEINAGKWNDLQCHWSRFAICQQFIISAKHGFEFEKCEHFDYVRYGDSCYKIFDSESAMNWTQANDRCVEDRNGSLLWIENRFEHSFIQYWTQKSMKSVEFWIGLSSMRNTLETQYEWINEWPVYFTSWATHEPHIRPEVGHQCVTQDRDSGLWRNNPFCEDKRAFICKINAHSMPGDMSYADGYCPKFVNSTNDSSAEIWMNLHKRSKHCYWFSDNVLMDWTSASKHCRSRNGTLASIHSIHESELLKPFVLKYESQIWIGLYQSPSGQFRWEDGSATDFTNWFPGEPTDENTELCVELRAQDMTWNDIKCRDYDLRFICEIQKFKPIVNKTINGSETEVKLVDISEPISKPNRHEGLSGGVIALLLFILIIFIISAFLAFYLWLNKDQELNENCFCFKIFLAKNTENNSSAVNPQPNEAFDITNE